MRGIKFRAWQITNKVMYTKNVYFVIKRDGQIIYFADGCQIGGRLSDSFKKISKEDKWNVVPMQSTGLHDKNGKEIFEGDVLTVTYPNGGLVRGVIIWGNCGFQIKILFALNDSRNSQSFPSYPYPHYEFIGVQNCYKLEIIGNEVENSELLK